MYSNNCIACFIGNDFQYHLRILAQHKASRFEEVINEYKKLYVSLLNKISLEEPLCAQHQSQYADKPGFISDFQTLLEFSLNEDNIEYFELVFDILREAYLQYVKGNTNSSIDLLDSLLTADEKLIAGDYDENNWKYYFRGRIEESDLNINDMAHIPFNKRHLIKNQRYSLAGRPILYLSKSPLPIFYEMGIDKSNQNNLQVSAFIRKTSLDNKWKIFLFSNAFSTRIAAFEYINNQPSNEVRTRAYFLTDSENLQADFTITIAAWICSFKPKTYTNSIYFVEEYVLPQLVTEIANRHNYNGISYSSTRMTDDNFSRMEFYHQHHKTNIALFTNYIGTSLIDEILMSQFEILNPIRYIPNNLTITYSDCEKLCQYFRSIFANTNLPPTYRSIEVFLEHCRFNIKNDASEFTPYLEDDRGLYHMYLMYLIMLREQELLV